jgi:hypothetical protein
MSITSQAVQSNSTASAQSVVSQFINATDLPGFRGYTRPQTRPHTSSPDVLSAKRNPIAEFLTDDLYNLLREYDLINEKALRDFLIRRDYRKVRKELHMSRADAIDYLQSNYPYLQVDTIRKIVYRVNASAEKKRML